MARGEWHHQHRGARWLLLLLLVALLAAVIVLIIRNWSRPAPTSPSSAPPRTSAEDLLAERLARGEIDVDEYRRRRDALRSP